jgi:hypothetical protein
METRIELILKFMLAVAASKEVVGDKEVYAEQVLEYAEALVNAYYSRIC